MKTRDELENAVSEASEKRLGLLRLVHEILEEWCVQRLNGRDEQLKTAMLLNSYSDACHHFAESYFSERQALFNLHAYLGKAQSVGF